jgi:hypothetical protein
MASAKCAVSNVVLSVGVGNLFFTPGVLVNELATGA